MMSLKYWISKVRLKLKPTNDFLCFYEGRCWSMRSKTYEPISSLTSVRPHIQNSSAYSQNTNHCVKMWWQHNYSVTHCLTKCSCSSDGTAGVFKAPSTVFKSMISEKSQQHEKPPSQNNELMICLDLKDNKSCSQRLRTLSTPPIYICCWLNTPQHLWAAPSHCVPLWRRRRGVV